MVWLRHSATLACCGVSWTFNFCLQILNKICSLILSSLIQVKYFDFLPHINFYPSLVFPIGFGSFVVDKGNIVVLSSSGLYWCLSPPNTFALCPSLIFGTNFLVTFTYMHELQKNSFPSGIYSSQTPVTIPSLMSFLATSGNTCSIHQ